MPLPPHEIFFRGGISFLGGIAIASFSLGIGGMSLRALFIALAVVAYGAFLAHIEVRAWIPCAIAMALGAAYLSFADAGRPAREIPFGKRIAINALVTGNERGTNRQALMLGSGIRAYAPRYPEFRYGDRIRFEGVVRPARSRLVSGTVDARHEKITLVSRGGGSAVKRALFAMRGTFEESLKRILPREQAAFLAGLTLGTTEDFSPELLDKLRKSGTTHIVALSGSNATGVLSGMVVILGLFLAPQAVFLPAIGALALFTVMTGAEASLVRAAIMNGIAFSGTRFERIESRKNMILMAAFLMALWNPLILVFDLGFQLSFAAILGLAYIKPILTGISPIKGQWFLNAVSAQAGVMPVLAIAFGRANPLTIIPNIMIAPAVPVATFFGFLAELLGLAHPALAFAPAYLASLCLTYATAIITAAASLG